MRGPWSLAGLLAAVLWAGKSAATPVADDPALSKPDRREIIRTLEALEAEWFAVYESHDLAPLRRLIADDFVATLADGTMRGKAEHIAAYQADFEALLRVESSDVAVRVFTKDLAVVTGVYAATERRAPGSKTRYRFTDTWLLRRGQWQCVASHENRLY